MALPDLGMWRWSMGGRRGNNGLAEAGSGSGKDFSGYCSKRVCFPLHAGAREETRKSRRMPCPFLNTDAGPSRILGGETTQNWLAI
jgi:hypothetical protein